MVRSHWIGPVFGVLALTGLARGQTTTPSAPAAANAAGERFITVQDPGKPGQKCKVLKIWTEPNGTRAYQVQALDTGELMTLEELAPASQPGPRSAFQSVAASLFHWGPGAEAPPSVSPESPSSAVVIAPPLSIQHPSTDPSAPWPTAFVMKNAADASPPASPVVKKVEPASTPVVLSPLKDTPAIFAPAKPAEVKPTPPVVVVSAPAKPAEALQAPPPSPVVIGSPYNPIPVDGSVVKAPACISSNSTPTWKPNPVVSPPSVVKIPEPAPSKNPTAVVKAETTPSPQTDWRESWGKIDLPKSAPVLSEIPPPPPVAATLTVAAPKVELAPHAQARTDDPLRSPDKYAKTPFGDGPGLTTWPGSEKKGSVVALLAFNQPPATLKPDEKKPESPAPKTSSPPLVAAEGVVVLPPPPPLVISKDPAPATVAPPAQPELKPIAAVAKPVVPLGMGSVAAAASPELAPPALKKPAPKDASPPDQGATGIRADEPNAFTEPPAGRNTSVASNAFSGLSNPAAAADAQANALKDNAFIVPPQPPATAAPVGQAGADGLAMQGLVPVPGTPQIGRGMPGPSGGAMQAGYRQEMSPEASQLAGVLRGSLYPSQREWAAERLRSLDWRQQPQILDLLTERAKQDPAPTVRAECVRSLGLMGATTLAAVETVRALRSDADPRVRQEADEAYGNIMGATPVGTNGDDAPPSS